MDKQNLSFRCMVYQEKDNTFTGVCLDLDIVEEGYATLQEAILGINDAVQSHIEAVVNLNYPTELLSRPAPKKYWRKLLEITKPERSFPEGFGLFQFFTTQGFTNRVLYA